MPQTQVLIDREDERFVNLSREAIYGDLHEVNAKLMIDGEEGVGVVLIAMRQDGKTKRFALEANGVNALYEAIVDYKTYIALKKEQEAREVAEKLQKLHERVTALGGTLTLTHKADGDEDWDTYTVEFEGRWAHCTLQSVAAHHIEYRVKLIENTLESEGRAKSDPNNF